MSTVIPQSFSTAEGQIINIITPSMAQEVVTAHIGEPVQLVQPVFTPSLQPIQQPDLNIEKDKQDIYKHPLFPLMAMLFEKCEQASAVSEMPSNESIIEDIQLFLLHQQKENDDMLSHDAELDNLMVKAIQVLRIHLLELEKVNELCKDFCQRYTSCLKGKLQSENLLRTESDYDQSMFDEPPSEDGVMTVPSMVTSTGGGVILQQPFQSSVPALGPGQIMSGGTIYQMVQTAQGLVAQPLQLQQNIATLGSTPLIHGSTPLSQIGVATPQTIVCASESSGTGVSIASGFDSDDDDGSKKKNKRGVLPKSATQVMKSWLFQHIVHPYPTEDEKRHIASQTNLTLLQVNNWFINARRRILQPMLQDSGNPESTKSKKTKTPSKTPQRFWPFVSSQSPVARTKTSSADTVTATTTETTDAHSVIISPSSQKAIIIPSGAFFSVGPDGAILKLPGANVTEMLNNVAEHAVPSPPLEIKDSSDTNNNSHNTDNDSNENDTNTENESS